MASWTIFLAADGPYGVDDDATAEILCAAFAQMLEQAGHTVTSISCIGTPDAPPARSVVAVDNPPSPPLGAAPDEGPPAGEPAPDEEVPSVALSRRRPRPAA